MKLISDIISELVNPEKTLTGPFLQTKVFASMIENKILLNWINLELRGYNLNEDLPSYRQFSCLLIGDWINGTRFNYAQGKNMQLPVSGYDDDWQDYLTVFCFRQSTSTLENFLVKNNKEQQLIEPLPADICEIISSRIRKNGNPYFNLISASKKVSLSVVSEILSTLRGNLLDFMIKIDKEFGYVTDINQLASQEKVSNQITNIMNQTIIKNTGDGNVVNTGNKNITTVSIQKGDFSQLQRRFEEQGIKKEDLNELKEIIDSEIPKSHKGEFNQKVTVWIKKMLTKALDGSWKISIAVAGKLLADSIHQYYGH